MSASESDARKRLFFSDDECSILKAAWEQGMTRENSPQVAQVAVSLGCSVKRVKNWISNYRKKVQGKTYDRKKVLYVKGRSAYNQFCREKGGEFNSWASEWKKLTEGERQQYRERATMVDEGEDVKRRKKAKLLKLFSNCVEQLKLQGIEIGGLSFDSNTNTVEYFGTSQTLKHFKSDDLSSRFREHCSQGMSVVPPKQPNSRVIRTIFKTLYSSAVGKPQAVPYKKLDEGSVKIQTNMPGLTIKRPATYGNKTLREILEFDQSHGLKFYVQRVDKQDTCRVSVPPMSEVEQEPAEQVPEEEPAEQVPEEEPAEQVPEEEPAEQVPEEEPAEQVPDQEPAEQVPDQEPVEQVSEETAGITVDDSKCAGSPLKGDILVNGGNEDLDVTKLKDRDVNNMNGTYDPECNIGQGTSSSAGNLSGETCYIKQEVIEDEANSQGVAYLVGENLFVPTEFKLECVDDSVNVSHPSTHW